jgi:hypothetical protein
MVDYNEAYVRTTKTLTPYPDNELTDIYVRLEIIMREIETAFAHFSPLFDSAIDEMLRRNLIEKRPPSPGAKQ